MQYRLFGEKEGKLELELELQLEMNEKQSKDGESSGQDDTSSKESMYDQIVSSDGFASDSTSYN